MSAYGSRSKTSTTVSMFAEFRHPRFFTDDEVRHLYPDLIVKDEDGKRSTLKEMPNGTPCDLKQYAKDGVTEDLDRDAYVAFKRVKIGSDDRGVRELCYKEDAVDWVAYDAALAGGTPLEEAIALHLEGNERTDYAYAKAEYFTKRVAGLYFVAPKGTKNRDIYGDPKVDPEGNAYGDQDDVPDGIKPDDEYEHAGSVPPISAEVFAVWSISLLGDYLVYMDVVHGGRSPVQEETFPQGTVPADDVPDVPKRRGTSRTKPA